MMDGHTGGNALWVSEIFGRKDKIGSELNVKARIPSGDENKQEDVEEWGSTTN